MDSRKCQTATATPAEPGELPFERWRKVLAKRLKVPYWTVDADVVVPSRVFNRSFVLLHHFRPQPEEGAAEVSRCARRRYRRFIKWKPKSRLRASISGDITEGFTKLDRSVRPVDSFTGGTHAALKRLERVREP
jgi:deoxyribodipyrimidine photo-lyase